MTDAITTTVTCENGHTFAATAVETIRAGGLRTYEVCPDCYAEVDR